MQVAVPIVNAFVDGPGGGNPAGVVLNAQQFTRGQKQRIAAAVGFSETAFVSPSSQADFKLEFFTPTRQIAHCGHATIAAFSYLRQTGALPQDRTSKETIDGRREILMEGDFAYMEQRAPRYTEPTPADRRRVRAALGLDPSDIPTDAPPCIVNTGNAFMIVALRRSAAVAAVRPDTDRVAAISEAYDLIGCYVFSSETVHKGRDAGARMFAPRYGIAEESATGMAAGPLACYLHDRQSIAKSQFLVEQGYLMSPASPSLITVRLHVADGAIQRLMAGGRAAVSEVRHVEI